jgi:hypothetical protein
MAPSFVQAAISLLCVGSAWADSRYAVVLDKRAAVPSILPGTWAYQGCYTDTGARVLSGSSYVNATGMTDESCIKFCDGWDITVLGANILKNAVNHLTKL